LGQCNDKKVIVTGGNGFVGKHLVDQLIQQKIKVIIIDNLSNSKIDFNQYEFYGIDLANYTSQQISFYKADIRDKDLINDIFKENLNIDTCIHLAAKISVSDSIKNPTETMDVNIKGTHSVLEAAANNGVKNFVFASSAAVYGNSKDMPLKETERTIPISPYGESKLKGENLVFKYSNEIPNTTSLRFFNIYGIGQSLEYAGVITKFAERLANGQPLLIYGDGYQLRDFISVKDIVRSIVMASTRLSYKNNSALQSNDSNNIFNIATGKPIKIIDLAKILINLLKTSFTRANIEFITEEIIFDKPLEGDILQSYADVTKAEEYFGFKYREDVANGLKNMYNNLKK